MYTYQAPRYVNRKRRIRWGRVALAAGAILIGATMLIQLFQEPAEATSPASFKEVTMWEGGTIWQVAAKNNPEGKDIREVIYEDIYILVNGKLVPYHEAPRGWLVHPGTTIYVKQR